MQFSVEVKRLKKGTLYVCRGVLEQGKSLDYMFQLLTRPSERTVILDVAELTVEDTGLHVLAISSEFLLASNRHLFLLNAPKAMLQRLRDQHGTAIPEWESPSQRQVGAKAVSGAAL